MANYDFDMMKRLFSLVTLLAVSGSVFAGPVIKPEHKAKAARLVSQMTIDEKIDLISGKGDGFHTAAIPRLGIPSISMADGPQGLRNVNGKNIESTFFPCGVSAAASWNREALYDMGAGIGCAAKAHGIQIMLGPGVNIYRSALCGRNFEYYGEDPYLTSEIALSYINGMQDQGVMSTIKHFAMNQQEYDRHGVSSNADERTMNEIYFPSFRKAVEKGHVGAVMTSYNPVNGVHASENAALVKDNLRAWGHEGLVMSDWTSTYTPVGFIKGGIDLEMPRAYVAKKDVLKDMLQRGAVTEDDLDTMCCHILQSFIAFGFLDKSLDPDPKAEDSSLSRDRAYRLALEGPVLLKNDDNILPLKKGSSIALIGPNANVIVCGGGSGWVTPEDGRGVTPYEGLSGLGKHYKVSLMGNPNPEQLAKASAVVVCIGFNKDTESEGHDRKYALDSYQNDLVKRVAEYNKNVVVVVNSGGELDMPWASMAKAIILDWYPGQEGGNALAAIISGKVSSSGKLPFTWWGSLKKNPAQQWYGSQPLHPTAHLDRYPYSEYREGVFLGYRGEGQFDVKPLYPFGYGMSYASFEYSGLSVVKTCDGGFDISFQVRNTSKYTAKEAAQVYVSPVNPAVPRPVRELKGFDKKAIAPGQSADYCIHLEPDAFSYYSASTHEWVTDPCPYRIEVGSSSADIHLSQTVQIPGGTSSVKAQDFGSLSDGTKVTLFHVTNVNGASMDVIDYGCRIVSINMPDRTGRMDDVVVGPGNIAGFEKGPERFFGPVIGRYGNRINHSAFVIDGTEYKVEANETLGGEPVCCHGGPVGFDRVMWTGTPVSGPGRSGVRFHRISPDGEQGFPGALDTYVTFWLTDENVVKMEYEATTDKPTVVNLSNHTYFNLHGRTGSYVMEHLLKVEADTTVLNNLQMCPDKLLPVEGTPFDFREFHTVDYRLDQPDEQLRIMKGMSACWKIRGYDRSLRRAADLYDSRTGRGVETWTTEPALLTFTGRTFDPSKHIGKYGPIQKYGGMLLETIHFADSPNQDRFPSTVLRPGERYYSTTEYRFYAR